MTTQQLKEAIPIHIARLIEAGNNHIIHQYPIPLDLAESFNDLIIKLDSFINDELYGILNDLGFIDLDEDPEDVSEEAKQEILGRLSIYFS